MSLTFYRNWDDNDLVCAAFWTDLGEDTMVYHPTYVYHQYYKDMDFEAPVGKVFDSWNTERDGSGTTVPIGTNTNETRLYAIWNKVMKSLTVGDTKYIINDDRVDSLQNKLDDKLDAPAYAGSSGKVLTLDSNKNPTWQSVPTELPYVSASDNGKLLTVYNGAWAKRDAPTELPSVTSSDNGKMLTVTNGAWAKGDAPTELPSVSSSDNGKILKVTSGAWAKGDAPSGLPTVTTSDNYKSLIVSNGVWTKGNVSINVLDSSLRTNISNMNSSIINHENNLYEYTTAGDESSNITYIKGTLNADGTINTTGSGIISNIIKEVSYIEVDTWTDIMSIAFYDDTDRYIGKINENFEIDTDPSTGWYITSDFTVYNTPSNYEDYKINGVRIVVFDTTPTTITNNSDAQNYGESMFNINRTKRASYDYVDNKLDNKLDKPATAGTTGQVLSLNSSGDTVWTNASSGSSLPSVTNTDNGKVLQVSQGQWKKSSISLPGLSASVNSLSSKVSEYDKILINRYDIGVGGTNGITYMKGTVNADGTIDTSGNGIVSSIIREPVGSCINNDGTFKIICYDKNDVYIGGVGNDEISTNPSDWLNYGEYNFTENPLSDFDPEIRKIRLVLVISFNISDDEDAQAYAESNLYHPDYIKRASYEYVDALKERIDKLESWTTPRQLQMICAAGLAPHYFNIGDIIYIEWTDRKPSTPVTYQYPFVVAHFGTVYDENDIAHDNAMYLMAMYATPRDYDLSSDPPVFDQPEAVVATGTFDTTNYDYYTYNSTSGYILASVTNGATIPSSPIYYKYYKSSKAICPKSPHQVMSQGWNRYAYSAIRQWLNSDAPKGTNWWTPQHELDVAPSDVTLRPGWLDGFSQEWKEVFRPIRIKTWNYDFADTTYDKFFIPSVEQVYGVPVSGSTDEGEYWEYWKNVTELNQPSNGSSPQNLNAGRFIPPINHIEDATDNIIHLRSNPRGNTSYKNYMIYAGYGTFAGYIASYSCQTHATVLPTFVLF